MTAAARPRAASGRPAGFGGLMLAEWTKIRSVRSTFWTLILFAVITVGLTAGLTELVVANWTGPQAGQRNTQVVGDPIGFILGTGIGFGQLTICVLGVLVISTEYSTGVIRTSLLAVPRRMLMLAAKVVVFAVLLLVLSEIVVFGSFLSGSALLHGRVPVSLSDPGVSRAIAGAGLYLAVLGVFSLAIGGLIRHTAGAIATVIGVVLVIPIITSFLPGSWGKHINAYLPAQAGSLVYTASSQSGQSAASQSGQLLTPWQGFGVFCLWTVILLAVMAVLLQRRDA
jgi:ABC-2 type transport system permease protein